MTKLIHISLILCLALSGCAELEAAGVKHKYNGVASWYSKGKRTADGNRFNPDGLSVAHRTLPFGTMLRLTNPENGNTIDAVVNDRGPFVRGKEIDVSRGGAKALGFFHSGTAKLLIEVLEKRKD
jgi:rare lipoprotein A